MLSLILPSRCLSIYKYPRGMQFRIQCHSLIMQALALLAVIIGCAVPLANERRNNVCPTIEDYYTIKDNPRCWYDVAADLDVPGTIRGYGYDFELHQVTTADGFILTLHRIPNTGHPKPKRFPVFLQHGLIANSANFATQGKNISMAFGFADAGYDVWMGNFRGTVYSQGHVNLTARDPRYWEHSIDHLGQIDLPTMLNKVVEVTGKRGDIIFIGHSLGTTLGLIYSSAMPKEATETLKFMVLLAPAASLRNMISPVRAAAPLADFILNLLPVFFRHVPTGSSIKVVRHAADLVLGNFRMYNFGPQMNVKVYGSSKPPKYDVHNIKIPTLIMYAVNDWACGKQDAIELSKQLNPKIIYGVREISLPDFNHMDFLYGKQSKELVTNYLLKTFDNLHKLP